MGNGLLSSGGELWLRQRRLAQPAFHRERISAYASAMTAYTEQMLHVWRDGEVRDVHQEMMRVTLQIVSSVLFGADAAGEVRKVAAAAAIVQQTFAARLNSTILPPDILPTPANLRLRVAVRRLDGIVYRMIEERRAGREQADDLLSLFLRAQDEDGTCMTVKQLRDEVMTLFLAGHETTALALTWTLYLLSQHPEVEARLLTEIDAVLGRRNPTAEDRSKLSYTEKVVMESMRLYPPAWGLVRDAMKDCSLDGYRIEAGMYVAMSQWVMHRDLRYFDNPEQFQPDRWNADAARHRPKFAYFPFGGGGHLCIGSSFAMMEAILLLAMIVQRFHLSLVPAHPVVPQPAMTLRPAHGMRMVLHQR
jgi:cytochrome P450